MGRAGDQTDRRANARRDVRTPININVSDISSVISGRIQDISTDGMKVKIETTPVPFQIRDEVMFLVNQNYLKLPGQGQIVWTSPKSGTIGIKFTQLDEESKKSLDEFLHLFVHPTSNR